MKLFEAKFILSKNIEISQLGIKFRKLKSAEKKQIISDLEKYYFNNSFIDEAIKNVGMVVEGINALPAAIALAKKHNIKMPIVEAVGKIVIEKKDVKTIVNQLFLRNMKNEF